MSEYNKVTETRALNAYAAKLKRDYGEEVEVSRPNPPDAVYKLRSRTIWVEVTSLYPSEGEAAYLNKHGLESSSPPASVILRTWPGKHTQVLELSKQIGTRIQKKDQKNSYEAAKAQWGKGTLLLYLDDPLFSPSDLNSLLQSHVLQFSALQKFNEVYLYLPETDALQRESLEKACGLYCLFSDR